MAGLLTVKWVQVLPKSVQGDDYWLLTTSGIGPALAAFTLLALVLLYRATRLRTVMQLWLAVSLLLLLLDNAVTDLGAARATVGWAGGRVLALFSAVSVLAVYLMELDALRRRAELARQQAQSARDSLDLALEAGGMGDWEMDLVTGTARRTLRHDQIFGHPGLLPSWSKDDMLAHVLPEDRPAVEAAFALALREGRLDFECRIRRASDGLVRWVMATGRTFEDAEGRPVKLAGCVMDTTERRLTEERLRQAERMESVGQLTGGVAHDFNNLLTVVIGSLEMIKRSPGDPARVERFAAGALTAAQRGAEVTSKLLAFSRRRSSARRRSTSTACCRTSSPSCSAPDRVASASRWTSIPRSNRAGSILASSRQPAEPGRQRPRRDAERRRRQDRHPERDAQPGPGRGAGGPARRITCASASPTPGSAWTARPSEPLSSRSSPRRTSAAAPGWA